MNETLIIRYEPDAGTVVMYDAFSLLDVKVAQGEPVPFEALMWHDYRFLVHWRLEAPPTGDGIPQADGVP